MSCMSMYTHQYMFTQFDAAPEVQQPSSPHERHINTYSYTHILTQTHMIFTQFDAAPEVQQPSSPQEQDSDVQTSEDEKAESQQL